MFSTVNTEAKVSLNTTVIVSVSSVRTPFLSDGARMLRLVIVLFRYVKKNRAAFGFTN